MPTHNWIISGENSRTLKVGVIKFKKSKKVGVDITLRTTHITSSVHLSLNEFSCLPGREILDHFPVQGIHECITTDGPADGDYTYFDRVWEYSGDCGRLIRLGVKHFNTASYIFLKVYKRNGDAWARPCQINLSVFEFYKLESLYAEVHNCGMRLIYH